MKKVATFSVLLAIALLVTPCYAAKPATRAASGVKVYDASGQFVGILVGTDFENIAPGSSVVEWKGTVTIFIPSAGKLLELARSDLSPTSRTSILVYFDGVGCTGNPYMYASNDNIRDLDNLHDDLYLYYGPTTGKFYARGNEVWEAPIKSFSYMSGGISICEDAGGVGQGFVSMNQIDLPFVLPLQNPLRLE